MIGKCGFMIEYGIFCFCVISLKFYYKVIVFKINSKMVVILFSFGVIFIVWVVMDYFILLNIVIVIVVIILDYVCIVN